MDGERPPDEAPREARRCTAFFLRGFCALGKACPDLHETPEAGARDVIELPSKVAVSASAIRALVASVKQQQQEQRAPRAPRSPPQAAAEAPESGPGPTSASGPAADDARAMLGALKARAERRKLAPEKKKPKPKPPKKRIERLASVPIVPGYGTGLTASWGITYKERQRFLEAIVEEMLGLEANDATACDKAIELERTIYVQSNRNRDVYTNLARNRVGWLRKQNASAAKADRD